MRKFIRIHVTDTIGTAMITAVALFVVLMFHVRPVDAGERPLAGSAGKPVRKIRVVLPDKAGPEMLKIAEVFGRQVSERCGARVTTNGEAPLRVELAIRPGIGKEGFSISKAGAGTIRITGNDTRGVLYGVGKFLRTSRFEAGGLTPGAWEGTSVPKKPIRGIYFATHFHNYYHDGPVEEIQRYVEELALWGCNSLMVWYDMNHFNGFEDPKAVAFRERLRGILQTATDLGIGTGFIVIGNEGYSNSPRELRSTGGKRGAYYECQICPNKPGGLEYELRIQAEMMDWMRPLKPQFLCIWPFDPGGCDCEQCRPWASNGFLKCAKPIAKVAREKLPGVRIILSNWFYRGNEPQELGRILSAEPPWIDMVMGPVPGTKIPAVNFPEISMLNVQPWGGYGATPVPERLHKKYSQMANLTGGWPYSEGLFEDMNKVVMLQLYWRSEQPFVETLTEYAGFEFSPEVAEDVVAMVKIFEKNHSRRSIGADAIQAYELAQKVESRLFRRARASWRWRILYLRALIDKEMHLKKGRLEGDVLKDAFAELTRIYHAENALKGWLRPPQVK